MDFNFSSLADTSFVGSQTQYLKAYNIYEVTLDKIAIETIKGVKDPTTSFQVVALEFKVTDKNPGVFNTNLFFPKAVAEDLERPKFKNDSGHEYERPSRFENFKFTLMQIVEVLNPEGANKIKAVASKFKTVEDFVKAIIKVLEGKNNVVTNLKLVGRTNNGTVYATLPNACGINKSGEIFPINFLGNNLTFSAYEMTQMKKLNDAKPTDVASEVEAKDAGSIDDLLNDI